MKLDLRVAEIEKLPMKHLLEAKELTEKNLEDALFLKNELEISRWKKRLNDINRCLYKTSK